MINKDCFDHLVKNAILWIYSSKTGQLRKYENVDILQRKMPFTNKAINQYVAINDEGLDRLVAGIENSIWYYSKYREYLIWSTIDDDVRIRNILIKALRQRAHKQINECLKILKQEHDMLDTAIVNLFTNCVVTVNKYEDVKLAIDKYFINL